LSDKFVYGIETNFATLLYLFLLH